MSARHDDVLASDIVLSFVSHTKPRESITAILLTVNVFLLLCAYYLLKVAREPLILLHGGAEVKSYAAAGQAGLLVLVTYAYAALARRVNRVRLIGSVTLFFVVNLVGFAALTAADVAIGVPFYLWVGIFNLTMVAQFWSFAADIYDEDWAFAARGCRVGSAAWCPQAATHARSVGRRSAPLVISCICPRPLAVYGPTEVADRRSPDASSGRSPRPR